VSSSDRRLDLTQEIHLSVTARLYHPRSANSDARKAMPKYRFYSIDRKERLVRRPLFLECANDADAIAEAKQRLNRYTVEVWQLTRRVIRLDPRQKSQCNRIAS
jgi:hypothetical protein